MIKRRTVCLVVATLGAVLVCVRWANSRSRPPTVLGATDGRLAPCGDLSNCVSTQAANPQGRLNPIPLEQPVAAAIADFKAIIESMPLARVVEVQDDYLRAEFRSRILGFVDDLELAVDEAHHLIHVRSASRVGVSDMGVNRDRVEGIVRRYRQRGTF